MKTIERNEEMQRDYIPLAGGYEFQTKGKGSTTRLACPNDIRHPLSDVQHVTKAIENMCRSQHAELTRLKEQLRVARDALEKIEAKDSYIDGTIGNSASNGDRNVILGDFAVIACFALEQMDKVV